MSRVLVLGAGLVSRPLVVYLLEHGFEVTVASRTVSKAEALVGDHPNGRAISWTVDKTEELKGLVSQSDLVVSLLPYTFHVDVANICLEYGKHMLTTSYVSDAMKSLDEKAKYLYLRAERRAVDPLSSVKWGMVLVGIGLALLVGNLFPYDINEGMTFGLMFLFAGIAFLIYYFMQKGQSEEETTE